MKRKPLPDKQPWYRQGQRTTAIAQLPYNPKQSRKRGKANMK